MYTQVVVDARVIFKTCENSYFPVFVCTWNKVGEISWKELCSSGVQENVYDISVSS